MENKCQACGIEFEPKTPKISADKLERFNVFHVGCWAKINRAMLPNENLTYGPLDEDGQITFKVRHG